MYYSSTSPIISMVNLNKELKIEDKKTRSNLQRQMMNDNITSTFFCSYSFILCKQQCIVTAEKLTNPHSSYLLNFGYFCLSSASRSNTRGKEERCVRVRASVIAAGVLCGLLKNSKKIFPSRIDDSRRCLGSLPGKDWPFRQSQRKTLLCRKKLTKEEVVQFRRAVYRDYYFEMYYDEVPIWGLIGRVENREETEDPKYYKYFLYKHIHFDIHYNKDRVIEITARMDPDSVLDLTEDKEVDVEFTYTVKWKGTDILFENQMDKFMQTSLPHTLDIHSFSIINSCFTVLFLTGFLAMILMRVLKNDFIK
ncbi:hypothetical protein RND71_002433 [Anisodus tanguticus]|uniref:Transmembrane 9 superfamily member n=1 Tax=Anisodus tanguticus TaxID=243964 RepID=A0AAE1T3R6_9SOLA|nr:hypothetical protein RND71_002433 [Anisodus tanguticus]